MNKVPYESLGKRLKQLRMRKQASTAEVSGAIEIDEPTLVDFESGVRRPSEDILHLLISFFDMPEDDAASVWKLAGYEAPKMDDDNDDDIEVTKAEFMKEAMQGGHAAIMMLAHDPRIIYSDGVDITANKQGVVLNFTQAAQNNSRVPVSRIGVSYEQAKGILDVLQKTIEQAEQMNAPKHLPSKSDDKNAVS